MKKRMAITKVQRCVLCARCSFFFCFCCTDKLSSGAQKVLGHSHNARLIYLLKLQQQKQKHYNYYITYFFQHCYFCYLFANCIFFLFCLDSTQMFMLLIVVAHIVVDFAKIAIFVSALFYFGFCFCSLVVLSAVYR